jgi:hypothetical protein
MERLDFIDSVASSLKCKRLKSKLKGCSSKLSSRLLL